MIPSSCGMVCDRVYVQMIRSDQIKTACFIHTSRSILRANIRHFLDKFNVQSLSIISIWALFECYLHLVNSEKNNYIWPHTVGLQIKNEGFFARKKINKFKMFVIP